MHITGHPVVPPLIIEFGVGTRWRTTSRTMEAVLAKASTKDAALHDQLLKRRAYMEQAKLMMAMELSPELRAQLERHGEYLSRGLLVRAKQEHLSWLSSLNVAEVWPSPSVSFFLVGATSDQGEDFCASFTVHDTSTTFTKLTATNTATGDVRIIPLVCAGVPVIPGSTRASVEYWLLVVAQALDLTESWVRWTALDAVSQQGATTRVVVIG